MPTYTGVNVMARQMNPTVDGQEWLVLINQDNRRMMSTREVQAEVQSGRLPRETLVWRAGMAAWASISSIAELATQNTRPTVPRARPATGYDAPLAAAAQHATAHDAHAHQHAFRPSVPNPQVMLELVATGAAVVLIVLITSYTLYAGGAFTAGSAPHDAAHVEGAQAAASPEAHAEH